MIPACPVVSAAVPANQGLLERSLEAGEWRPGEAIPSEHELAGRFGVSQGTVRKAIEALAADNLVVRRQGKGTFVATHTEEKSSSFRFLRIRRNDGVDEYPGSRLARRPARQGLGRGRAPARPQARRRRDPPAPRFSNTAARPSCWTTSRFRPRCSRGLTRARFEAYRGSMYGFFETQFGVRMLERRGKIACGRCRRDERAAARRCDRDAAPRGRPDHAHVRRAAGRMAPRPLRDGAAPLFQSSGL